jgi:hypothetical protein
VPYQGKDPERAPARGGLTFQPAEVPAGLTDSVSPNRQSGPDSKSENLMSWLLIPSSAGLAPFLRAEKWKGSGTILIFLTLESRFLTREREMGRRWTDQEVLELKLLAQHHPARRIAELIDRTIGAVFFKAHTLKVALRTRSPAIDLPNAKADAGESAGSSPTSRSSVRLSISGPCS